MTSLPALAERVGWAIIHSLWQGVIIALLLAIALRLLRRNSAAARHMVCLLALAAMLAGMAATAVRLEPASPTAESIARAPVSFSAGPAQDEPAVAAATQRPPRADSPQSSGKVSPLVQAARSSAQSTASPAQARTWQEAFAPFLPWIAGVWISGVIVLSLRHAGGWHRLRVLRRSGAPATSDVVQEMFAQVAERLGVQRAARLLESARIATPMLIGVLKPVVLLPFRVASGLGPRELEAIFAHELAHLARRDAWANLFQIIVETVLFYHPVVWWIGSRARIERENAADDLAVRVCTDRLMYAGALARLAEWEAATQSLALAATDGSLFARIRRVLGRPADRETEGAAWIAGGVAIAACSARHFSRLAHR